MKVTPLMLIVGLCGVVQADDHCVYRSFCQLVNGFQRPCLYEGPPVQAIEGTTPDEQAELISILENRCSALIYDEDGNRIADEDVLLCCDREQIRDFEVNAVLAESILGRCPRCLRNFLNHVCVMACSPEQSRFITPYSTTPADGGAPYIEEIDYRLHEDFMLDAFDSCAGVVVPQTGLQAISVMCGSAPVCDADAWFRFVGDTENNPMTPFQINIHKTQTLNDSMHISAPPCNETYEGDLPCSCVDCVVNCPLGSEPYLPEICSVLNINCLAFSVGLVFFVLTVTIFSILSILEYRRIRNKNVKSENKKTKTQGNRVDKIFEEFFSKIGAFSADNPVLVIMLCTWFTFAMAVGLLQLRITANPIELWSGPESRTRQHLNYFNSRFGPFYRATQVFLTFEGIEPFEVNNITYGPAFSFEAVKETIALENAIKNIGRDDDGVTLEEVCYAPLRSRGSEQLLEQCVTMSVSVYVGNDLDSITEDTYLNKIQSCVNNHYSLQCLASWGGGSEPEITFGGFETNNVNNANTLLLTLPIANAALEENLKPVLEWEQKFLDLMYNYDTNLKPDYVKVAYAAERSIEDELVRVSVAEILPIAISYILMLVYVTIALGNKRNWRTWLVESKISVAVSSILTVLIVILCATGVMGYSGITITLLAINVIPFFVLSVGIDNVFLMVNTLYDIESNLKSFDDYNRDFTFNNKRRFVFSKMLGKVGPSMFVSSVTQITCFAIGTITNLPAVFSFAAYATISLAFLFMFQITAVIGILSLDYKRASTKRLDIFCCVQKKILDDEDPLNSEIPHVSLTQKLMGPYSKFITNWKVKIIVAIFFMGVVLTSVLMIPSVEVGLDQELALPKDSYVYRYLEAVRDLLRLGPPVYFILKGGLNFTDTTHQNVICGGQLCHEDSLATQIFLASRYSNITTMARSSNSWLDDFIDWTSLTGNCCKYNVTDGGFCQSSDTSLECANCLIEREESNNGLRPSAEAFGKYIPFFLQDEPTDSCSKGGLASYFTNVNYVLDSEGVATVYDTNFMAYHTPLSVSEDYIDAVKYGYEISENITNAIKLHTGLDVEVFPYSIFYVFYEQYLTIWSDTFSAIGYCLLGAFLINLIATGFNLLTTFAVIFTATMIVVTMGGVMYLWSIPLNAVSLINLIVSIGIAVEFCSHIAQAFSTSKSPQNERVQDAIQSVGATIITGITFTNIPVIVLAFSYTEIIEVFFFRMFFSIVLLGFSYGMIFFPVLLSYLNDLKRG